MSFLGGGGGGGKANFDRLLESATSQMLLEPSWATNLEICDAIRQNDASPKYALAAIRKKIKDPNPHVSKFALVVLEACVKNCGQPFHEELASHDFMDDMRTLAQNGSAPVKEQVLSMLQAWNHAFRNKTNFQPILATYNLMKMEGYEFPPLSESDAMFSADAAPAWKEGDVCHLCRVKFATFTRQHHCRACGEVFCSKCSSKQSIIPKVGIEREVRVCDPCYDEINPDDGKAEATSTSTATDDSGLPAEYLNSDLAKEAQTKPKLSESQVKAQEEDEMQLALALSLSEEESNKGTSKNWSAPAPAPAPVRNLYELPKIQPVSEVRKTEPRSTLFSQANESLRSVDDGSSSELSKYLDRSYWEKKNAENKSREPSAPIQADQVQQLDQASNIYADIQSDSDEEESFDSSAFVQTVEKSIEMFVDRMNNVRMKGKHIAMDTTVQSLFQSLSVMHPQLMKLIEDEEDSKVKYEAMLQKLSVIREARETLDDMRAQHQEKVRQQELEQEMLRRMQMEQKLELMRQQKQEYLEYQRLLQIQRQQELEVYQQEKLRQRQIPGMVGYPGETLDSYQYPSQQGVPSMGNMPLDNPSMSQATSNMAGAQVQVHYDQTNPPPQYSGYDANDAAPPSYALATNKQQPQIQQQQQKYQASGNYYQEGPRPDQQQPVVSNQWQPDSSNSPQQLPSQQQGQSQHHLMQQQQLPPQQHQLSQQRVPQQPQQLPAQPQQVSVQPQQLPPQPQQLPPQPQQLPHQFQHLPPNSQQLPPQSQQLPPPSQQLPPQSQQLPPQAQHLPPQAQHLPPQQQVSQQPQQVKPQLPPQQHQPSLQQVSNQPQPSPQMRQLPPQPQQLPPQQQQQFPQQHQLPPNQQQQHQPQEPQQQPFQQQPQQQQQSYQQPQYPSQPASQYQPQQSNTPQQDPQAYGQQGYQNTPPQQPGYHQNQYPEHPQQNYQVTNYPTNQPGGMQELTGNMKDLQLISFD